MIDTEPEWDDSSRRAALALQAHEDEKCPLCSRPMSVCQAEENEFNFVVDPPSRCNATTARLKVLARRAKDDSVDQDTENALLWGARLKG